MPNNNGFADGVAGLIICAVSNGVLVLIHAITKNEKDSDQKMIWRKTNLSQKR